MKNILYKTAFVFGFLVLVGFGIAHASDQKFVSLDKDTTINSSYIRAGNNVTINGTVNGDVIVTGSNIIIDGTVNGNVYAAGQKIRVGGTVNGGLHLAAETIEVNAKTSGGSYIAGSKVKLGNDNKIGRGLYVASSEATLEGEVNESVGMAAATIAVNGVVGGDVSLAASEIALGDKAKVGGNLKYRSETIASIQNDRAIGGSIVRVEDPQPSIAERVRERLGSSIYWFVASAIIAFLVLRYVPGVLVPATSEFVKSPLNNAAKGALFIFFVPIGLLMLFISVIGMPVAFLLGLAYAAVLALAPIATAFFIGMSLRKVSVNPSAIGREVYLATLLGLGIVVLLSLVPFLGGMFSLLVAIIGVGIIISRGVRPLSGVAPKAVRKAA